MLCEQAREAGVDDEEDEDVDELSECFHDNVPDFRFAEIIRVKRERAEHDRQTRNAIRAEREALAAKLPASWLATCAGSSTNHPIELGSDDGDEPVALGADSWCPTFGMALTEQESAKAKHIISSLPNPSIFISVYMVAQFTDSTDNFFLTFIQRVAANRWQVNNCDMPIHDLLDLVDGCAIVAEIDCLQKDENESHLLWTLEVCDYFESNDAAVCALLEPSNITPVQVYPSLYLCDAL
jgi:hypothetical protein